MLFLSQHYFYAESDIKEPQPPPFPPPFFWLRHHTKRKYSFHCFLYSWSIQASAHCYHFLSLNMNYFNPPAINSLLDENKKD